MPNYSDYADLGNLLGTTQVYDLSDINQEDFIVRLRNNLNNILLALNNRDSGYYAQEEYVNGQLFYPDYTRVNSATTPVAYRQVYRKVIDTGALLDTDTTRAAHGITLLPETAIGNTTFIFTRIYGCATDPANRIFLPLPFASPTLAENIKVFVDRTNINITTGSNRTAFTTSHVVVEYIKY